jgi:hypothetical protein
MAEAGNRRISESPLCAHLDAGEAVTMLAGNFFEAVFHDLEQTSGLNVWTYAENLASGWMDQGGHFDAFFDVLDELRGCVQMVLDDIARGSEAYAVSVEVAIYRALVVAEMAAAGVIAERLRSLESQLQTTHEETFRPRDNTEQPTIPFLGGPRLDAASEEVGACLRASFDKAAYVLPESDLASVCLSRMHGLAVGSFGGSDVLALARELYDEDNGTMPLFEALEQARHEQIRAMKTLDEQIEVKASATMRLARAYQSVANGVGVLVVDAGRPITDELREMAEHTSMLRKRARRLEEKLADLEAQLGGATAIDATRPEKYR